VQGKSFDYFDLAKNPCLYDKLRDSADDEFISQVIADTDESKDGRKVFLIDSNLNLSEAHYRTLAGNENWEIRSAVARRKEVPADVLTLLLSDAVEEVRLQVLWNPQSDLESFTEGILKGKLSSSAKKRFCHSDKVARNFEVFEFFWNTVRGSHSPLVDTLNYAVVKKVAVIDPRILELVHDTVRSGDVPNVLKESYASSAIALPEFLDEWKDDSSRLVLNAIARNKAAWVSTHDHLVTTQKSTEIRVSIARVTDSYILLNKIYKGTKGERIRYYVERNPVFASGLEEG
jgi:hypothetical protein